ncbi:MAG TPA: cytochrome c [Acidobacteriota bacterium]|nr:cytochrome c [Acidobacteriota bacterium]
MNQNRSMWEGVRRRVGSKSAIPRTALLAALAALVAAGCDQSPPKRATSARPADTRSREELIARGKQISYSSACHDCHTPGGLYGNPDSTRAMSGSELGWEGPWGVTYPRNLTPDPETGIASWTEEEIVRAFRTGIRPDGSPILPPMPWPVYARMSDEDAYALAAYIKSLVPIRHKAPDRAPPGTTVTTAKVTFPPPPAWDGRHIAAAQ